MNSNTEHNGDTAHDEDEVYGVIQIGRFIQSTLATLKPRWAHTKMHVRMHRIVCIVCVYIYGKTYQVSQCRSLVFLGAQTNETIAVHVYDKWIDAQDEDIDSQIELVPVNQERLVQVELHDGITVLVHFVAISTQNDALALASRVRFDDKGLILT